MLAELRLLDEVENGLDAVIVRPPWFYGPHQPARQTEFFTLVRRGRFPVVGDGRQRRSMVYVDDLVDGIVRAELAECPPGRGWWIADSRPYEINEIVTAVGEALVAAGLDVAPRQLRAPPSSAASPPPPTPRCNDAIATCPSCTCSASSARRSPATSPSRTRELGYEPSVGLAEGMRRSVAWCLAQGLQL